MTILSGVVAGSLLAIGTAQLVLRLKLNTLLAGIILNTMVYSFQLRVLSGPNVCLFRGTWPIDVYTVLFILIVCAVSFMLFLRTDFGLRFRALGTNAECATKYGISITRYTTLGLGLANAMFGLAGSLMVHMQEFMDVGMGNSIVIHGLASLMLGEAIIKPTSIPRRVFTPIVGALVYQHIQGLV